MPFARQLQSDAPLHELLYVQVVPHDVGPQICWTSWESIGHPTPQPPTVPVVHPVPVQVPSPLQTQLYCAETCWGFTDRKITEQINRAKYATRFMGLFCCSLTVKKIQAQRSQKRVFTHPGSKLMFGNQDCQRL